MGSQCIICIWVWKNKLQRNIEYEISMTKYKTCIYACILNETWCPFYIQQLGNEKRLNCENINKKTKEVTRDKCIPLRIKDDNVPPKFIVPIENATLKNHNSYKNGLENIKF